MSQEIQLKSLSDKEANELGDKIVRLAEILGETTFYPYQKGFAKRIVRSVLLNEGATITALFSRQCIAEGTYIYSPDGQILPIEKYPSSWKTSDEAEAIQLVINGGYKLTCTPNHPIFTPKGWIAAGDLKPNDYVAVVDSYESFGNGVIPYSIGSQNHTFTMSNDMARFLGTICPEIQGRYDTVITKDSQWVSRQANNILLYGAEYKKGKCTLRIDNDLFVFFKYIGCLDKYGFPRNLHHFTEQQTIAFLKPILEHYSIMSWDFDYHVRIRLPRKKQFMEQLKLVLLKLGINSSLIFFKNKWILRIRNKQSIKHIQELFGMPNNSYKPLFKTTKQQTTIENTGERIAFRPLYSIDRVEEKISVWDMEVPDKGWFIANGVKVHNSGKSQTVAMISAALALILPMLAKHYKQLEMYKKGFWVGIFGPVSEQATTLFDRINDINNTEAAKEIFTGEFRIPIPKPGGKQSNTIKYENGSLIRMHSAAPRSKIESKTYHFILLDECVSGDTEILTKDGWIRIDAWDGQEIAVLNSDFGMSYEVPKRYIKHDSVPLLTAKCKHGLEYTTTPGHNIVYTPTRNPMSIEKMQAEVFWKRGNGNCRAIRSGNLKDTYKLSYLERVGIMLNADGCKYNVKQNGDIIWKLEFSKKRKINRCKHLLTKAGIKYKEFEPRKFKNPKWNDSVKIVFTLDATDYKQSFRNWLPYNCGSDFINELLYWDGYRCKKTREYDSTDKSNVEFVEQICVQNRIDCSAIRAIERKNKDHNTLYRLDMGWKNGFSFGRNDKDIEVKYDKAYCFETSTGMFFIRKNGVVLVTGNCQDITSFKISKSISPMGASVNATTIATGTPDYYVGWFYNMIQMNKQHDLTCREELRLHHEADFTITQQPNPYYKKYVAKEMKKLGFDSPEFMMAYRLIWPISRGMLFTKAVLEEKCYNSKIGFVHEYKQSPCVAGLDLGKTIDSTVLTVIMPDWNNADEFGNMPKTILDWFEIEGDDWEAQYARICEKLERYWIDTLVVDATGLGDPVAERLALMLPSITVIPFVFTPANKDTAYKYLIQEVYNSRVIVPMNSSVKKTERFRKFEHQMTMLKKEYQGKFLSPQTADDKIHDDYCVDEETEILTERGFVSIDDIEEEDLVANFSLSDSTIYYKKPKRVIKKYYDGTMYDFIGKTVEQSVTENHRMLYYSDKLQDFNVQLSQDWYRKNTSGISYTKKIITTTIQDFIEEFPISDEEIQIAAWMITEGWITQSKSKGWNDARYQLGQSTKHNPKNVEEIDGIVKKLGLSYNEYLRTDGLKMWQFRKVSKPFFDSLLKDGVHTIPKEWLGKFSQRQLKLLFNTLMKGDGHRTPSSCYFYTKDMSLAQDFQELVFKIGYQATISKQDRNSGVIYNISVNLARKNGYVTEINTREYHGRVWCVETDSGFIVIRKNNKISVTGNCSSLLLAVYATYFEAMPEINVMENDFFRSNKASSDLFGRSYSRFRKPR